MILIAICGGAASADFKVALRTRSSFGPQGQFLVTESVGYLKDKRKRVERLSFFVDKDGKESSARRRKEVYIYQCDARRTVELDLIRREYASFEMALTLEQTPSQRRPTEPSKRQESGAPPNGSRTVIVERHTVDTGERQSILGKEARHLITTVRQTPQGARFPVAEEVVDAWYVPMEPPEECGYRDLFARPTMLGGPYFPDASYKITESGPKPSGVAVTGKITTNKLMWRPDGWLEPTLEVREWQFLEVVEEPLDPSLFDVPQGFRKVRRLHVAP